MENSYTKRNSESRERLINLIKNITEEELKRVIYKEGWTIATALGHIAFWDERRARHLNKWKKEGITASSINDFDTNNLNDALLPFLHAIAPRKLAGLAVAAALNVDKVIESLPPELTAKIEAIGDKYALDRSLHHNMHLDEIEALLKRLKKRTRGEG